MKKLMRGYPFWNPESGIIGGMISGVLISIASYVVILLIELLVGNHVP